MELLKRWEHAQQDFRDVGAHTQNKPVLFVKLIDKYTLTFLQMTSDGVWTNTLVSAFILTKPIPTPLAAEELPLIIDIRENFDLEDYTKRFILDDANFRMMGSSDFGHPVFYYHIIMVADQQSFRDGTLLHVDFNRSGDPALSFRYSALRSFFPWRWHHESPGLKLGEINEYSHESGVALHGHGYVFPSFFRSTSLLLLCLLAHSYTNFFSPRNEARI